jgi:hypothetical protein
MGAKIQAFDIFQPPLSSQYPLPLIYLYIFVIYLQKPEIRWSQKYWDTVPFLEWNPKYFEILTNVQWNGNGLKPHLKLLSL